MTSANYTASEGASPLIGSKTRAKHKLVYKVGVNDNPTPVYVDGKPLKAYAIWRGMLQRCYSTNWKDKYPTYVGCSVVEEWRSFTVFEKWFTETYIEGYDLDKDILIPGNQVYGPETCVFVPQQLNKLLTDRRAARGDYPLGVHFRESSQKYIAQINTEAGKQHLGCFTTPLEAHRVWQLAKSGSIETAETDNPRVRTALDRRAAQLKEDHANGRITTRL